MKSLKFMLLSAFVMLGTSAFAAVTIKQDNVGFGLTGGGGDGTSAAKAKEVQVEAVYADNNLTIADAFSKANEMDATTYYKVVGFKAGWENSGETGAKNVSSSLTTLTIKAGNMTNLTNAFDGLSKLANLTIENGNWTAIPNLPATITVLDLGKLTKVTTPATTLQTLTNLATLTLPENVEAIPDNFLNGLSKLATVNNLAKVTKIGANAFKGTDITAIDLAKITSVGDNAFDGCTKITALEIPATLTTIGAAAFANMTGLTTLTIKRADGANIPAAFAGDTKVATLSLAGGKADNPITISANAFADMPLTEIALGACPGVVAPASAFKADLALKKIKLAGSNTPIANIDLSGAKNYLKSVSFSAAETLIPANSFNGFAKLTTITIPAGVTIGANAFDGCAALESATFGDEVVIGKEAFKGCKALATLTFSTEDADKDGNTDITIGANAFEGCIALAEIVLPDNVTSLGANAFKDCTLLKKFVGGEGLTTIPAVFDGCISLKTVIIPKTVASIANNAFKDLSKLATVAFMHTGKDDAKSAVMTSIGANAFEGCVALTSIDLSKTQLTSLGNKEVFKGCSALASITLPQEMQSLAGNAIFAGTVIERLDASMVNGLVANIFGTDAFADPVVSNGTFKTLIVGNATIDPYAFAYCTKLKTVIAGAAEINPYAFANCDKLTTVTVLPYDVDTYEDGNIQNFAFDHCAALTTFNFTCDEKDLSIWGTIKPKAFTYCTPYVVINTTKEFASNYGNAPLNATWTAEALNCVVTTVQDKANANQFVAKFWDPANNVVFNAEDVKLYTVYVDGETAYFQACRPSDGKYYVNAEEHVILKTTEAKEVTYEVNPTTWGKNAVAFDDIKSLPVDGELGDIQGFSFMGLQMLNMQPGEYLYRLTNTAGQGFGFTAYTGTTIKANQFFISTTKKPESARLNTVWLDEDGNVEGEATAIKAVKNIDAENGEIYNLQGVRVDNPTKGLYIQNGKKIVVK